MEEGWLRLGCRGGGAEGSGEFSDGGAVFGFVGFVGFLLFCLYEKKGENANGNVRGPKRKKKDSLSVSFDELEENIACNSK